jgi:hypothetical protein
LVDLSGKTPAEPANKEPFRDVVLACERELGALLDVTHFLESSAPTDPRGPRCDIFVVADLAEPGVASVVAPLSATLAASLRRFFSPILRSGDGALVVCPVLVCPRAGDRNAMARALVSLYDVARNRLPATRLGGRIYLVEDQSGKYILSRPELIRSFAASHIFDICLCKFVFRSHRAGTIGSFAFWSRNPRSHARSRGSCGH